MTQTDDALTASIRSHTDRRQREAAHARVHRALRDAQAPRGAATSSRRSEALAALLRLVVRGVPGARVPE